MGATGRGEDEGEKRRKEKDFLAEAQRSRERRERVLIYNSFPLILLCPSVPLREFFSSFFFSLSSLCLLFVFSLSFSSFFS